ncbi:MAG: fatty acid desaturase [Actinobacteria bacterium]|nr:fatty acid desaturase [Actinomycetota bacterium]
MEVTRIPRVDEAALRREIADRRLTTPRPWRSLGHLAIAWGAYAVAVVVALSADHWAVTLLAWTCMAFVILGNGAVVHETLHGHLFPQAWANRLIGNIAGAWVGLPWSTYRAYHLGHHQASCTPNDPEGPPYRFTTRWYYAAIPVGGPLFAVNFVWWTLRSIAGSPPPFVRSARQRRDVVLDGMLSIAVYVGLIAIGMHDLATLATVWLVPWLFAIIVLEPLVLIPEHYGASMDDAAWALATTRTVRSNRVLTWIYWGNNFHTAHHVAPGVVPQHIRSVSEELVEPHLDPVWRSNGYLAFHARTLRQLPWRATTRRPC